MRLHAVVARQAWCAASSTVYLQLRSQYKAMKSDGLDQTLKTLPLPIGCFLTDQRARLFPQEDVPRGPLHRPITTPAVYCVPRPKNAQGCPPWHHLTQLPCSLLNGDGTDGRGGVQGFPAVKLARLEKLPRQIVASVTVHMQVPMGLSM